MSLEEANYPVVVRAARSKGIRNIIIVGASAAFCGWMVFYQDSLWEQVLAGVTAVTLAIIPIAARKRVLGKQPLLLAGTQGLHHPVVGDIPWDDVASLEIREGGYVPGLLVRVHDPDKYLARATGWHRMMMSIDKLFGQPLLNVPANLMDESAYEVKARLEALAGRPL